MFVALQRFLDRDRVFRTAVIAASACSTAILATALFSMWWRITLVHVHAVAGSDDCKRVVAPLACPPRCSCWSAWSTPGPYHSRPFDTKVRRSGTALPTPSSGWIFADRPITRNSRGAMGAEVTEGSPAGAKRVRVATDGPFW